MNNPLAAASGPRLEPGPPGPAAPRRGLLASLLRGLFIALLVMVLATLAMATAIYAGALHIDDASRSMIAIDGESLDFAGIGHAVIAAAALVLALVIVFTVVPLALFGAGLVVTAAFGVAALAVGGVALVLFSPLLLIGLVVWLLVRRSRRPTMAA